LYFNPFIFICNKVILKIKCPVYFGAPCNPSSLSNLGFSTIGSIDQTCFAQFEFESFEGGSEFIPAENVN